MAKFLRMKEAAELLGISTFTLRKYCNENTVPFNWSVTKQRIFNENELLEYKRKILGEPEPSQLTIFYARSSSGSDILISTQLNKLAENYGTAIETFTDKSSGLNDNRKGLNALLKFVAKNKNCNIYVTQKDRLTRFGFNYLKQYFELCNSEIIVLGDEETKEPQEVLMQDFMALLASFSGKFYRLRGWQEQRKLLAKTQAEVDARDV